MAIHKQTWEITDEFWEEVNYSVPTPKRDENKECKRKPMCP